MKRQPQEADVYPALFDPYARQPQPPTATAVAWHDRSIFEVMWSARYLLASLAVGGALLGGVVWAVRPSVYEASARLYVERPPTSGTVNPFRSGGATSAGPSAQEAVMKSYAVLLAAMQEPGIGSGPMLAEETDPITYLRKKLSVGVADDKETFTVRFRSTDPREAADVVNAVVRHYVDTQQRRASVTLGGVLGRPAGGQAGEGPGAAPEATVPTPALSVRVGSREMMSRLAEQELTRLGQEAMDAGMAVEAAKARLEAAEYSGRDVNHLLQLALESRGQVPIDPTAIDLMRRLEIDLNTAQARLNAVREQLGPEHRVRKSYESEVVLLGQQLAEARALAAKNLLATFAQAVDQALARRQDLQRRIGTTRDAALAIEQLAIEVLDPAVAPRKPVAPKLQIHLAVGTLAGLFAATLLGLVGEVRRVSESAEALGALVPPGGMLATHALAPPTHATGWDRPAPLEQGPVLLGTIPRIAATHRLVGPAYDRAADSVHQLRAVLAAMARREQLKSVAFVSPRRGTGRTSVTIGVASSLAMSGTSVLAVDGDLSGRLARRQRAKANARGGHAGPEPDRHDTLAGMAEASGHFPPAGHSRRRQGQGTQPSPATGIAGYLDGLPLEQCLKPAGSDRLAFLPASTAAERHVGVFSDRRMAELIDEARERFDLILFDSGPVPGSLEALSIASVADGVVLVLEENHDVAEYQRTMQYLKVIHANVLGVVLNKVGRREDDPPPPAHPANTTPSEHATGQPTPRASAAPAGPDFAEAGSGILAVSVFTDAESGYHESDWELTAVNDILPDLDDLPRIKPGKK